MRFMEQKYTLKEVIQLLTDMEIIQWTTKYKTSQPILHGVPLKHRRRRRIFAGDKRLKRPLAPEGNA